MSEHRVEPRPGGVTRRTFLGTVGVGGVGSILPPSPTSESAEPAPAERLGLALRLNGRDLRLDVEARATLLEIVRERAGLTGTKPGCERGECGACTVLIDGVPRYSCLTLAAEADGHDVTTVEGLLRGESLGPVQRAFVEEDAMQCGFCTPGQVMAAEGLLRGDAHPTLDQIRHGMSGNLCRCGAYAHIVKAVQRAARLRAEQGGA
jgi:xanthine dehydrogenase YagT iron-sulfur-binding subunit